MKTKLLLLMTAITVAGAALAANPLLSPYKTIHQTIPFDQIKTEHYVPAFEEAMKQHMNEINEIVNNPKAPTVENTIVALDKAGSLLNKVSSPFFNCWALKQTTNCRLLHKKMSPLLTEHSNSIRLNEKLFERVKAVYETVVNLN
jgi:peptidyl-dipeptidase Dcp